MFLPCGVLPHSGTAVFVNIAVFINILDILIIEWRRLGEGVSGGIPDDDLEGSKHVGLFLIKGFWVILV